MLSSHTPIVNSAPLRFADDFMPQITVMPTTQAHGPRNKRGLAANFYSQIYAFLAYADAYLHKKILSRYFTARRRAAHERHDTRIDFTIDFMISIL